MTTKNIQDVYLNIVAAFGATPLDEPEVKNILTQLVKEVEAREKSTTKEELEKHLKKIGWRFGGRYPNEWIIDHNGERTSYRVLSDSIEVVGVNKNSSVSFHFRGAETVMVDEDAVALGTQQCFILFMNHDLKKKALTPPTSDEALQNNK